MHIFPAIDLYEGKAVRLYKGDYEKMTVYSEDPAELARQFQDLGASFLHLVDLEGSRDGGTPNGETIAEIAGSTSLFVEVGGGIRTMDIVDRYLAAGVGRVILGTAAVEDEAFLKGAVGCYGGRIAVGIDVKDGLVAIRGWKEQSAYTYEAFFEKMERMGVSTVICTDISKDGAMNGANRALYRELSARFHMDLIASGGVSSLEDVKALRDMGLRGAIIGQALYTGAIDLREAIEVAR